MIELTGPIFTAADVSIKRLQIGGAQIITNTQNSNAMSRSNYSNQWQDGIPRLAEAIITLVLIRKIINRIQQSSNDILAFTDNSFIVKMINKDELILYDAV